MTRTLTLLAPCFNERENVALLHQRLAGVVAGLSGVACELVFIDNASIDGTQVELRKLVAQTERQAEGGLRVKVILNQRNFGHVRSPFHGLLAVSGDAVIVMASDLQDPPELIPAFVEKLSRVSQNQPGRVESKPATLRG